MSNDDRRTTGMGPSVDVNEMLRADLVPPPAELLETHNRDLGAAALSKVPYIAPEYHRLEVERMWKRAWQAACRERALPNVGDYVTYEIADQSIVIVRKSGTELAAYHNVCQHRGTRLVGASGTLGTSGRFVCPFHGWCYDRNGKLAHVPRAWDFPELDAKVVGLVPVKVDTWDGWIFVNFNRDAEPLREYLGETLIRHFALWPMANKRIVAHAAKVIPANWKATLEAFLEVYHVQTTHPGAGIFANDVATKYDQFGKHGRMHMLKFVAPNGMDEQTLVDRWIAMGLAAAKDSPPTVPEGGRARSVMARFQRRKLQEMTGRDFSGLSDAETIDTLEYFVFPNFAPWGAYGTNLVYRARPNGNDCNSCLFEVMITAPDPVSGPMPDAPVTALPEESSWMEAPGMTGLGTVLDEDVSNLRRVQLGLKSDGYTQVRLARYQEGLIRHLHATIEDYLRTAPT